MTTDISTNVKKVEFIFNNRWWLIDCNGSTVLDKRGRAYRLPTLRHAVQYAKDLGIIPSWYNPTVR